MNPVIEAVLKSLRRTAKSVVLDKCRVSLGDFALAKESQFRREIRLSASHPLIAA
ncbi:MAG: hypothetical protein ACUVWX_11665 [Kiritimatiellia bacterium]